jgi:hypothetical protein
MDSELMYDDKHQKQVSMMSSSKKLSVDNDCIYVSSHIYIDLTNRQSASVDLYTLLGRMQGYIIYVVFKGFHIFI